MAKFGKSSTRRLGEIHPDLRRVLTAAIVDYDFSIICGYRGEKSQNSAFSSGVSRLRYPRSKHNKIPALAVDIVPYPVDWSDLDRFREMKRVVFEHADRLGVDLVWGADWDGDGDEMDHSLRDYPHFELAGKR